MIRCIPRKFIDAIHVKVRDGQVTNRPVYVAIGVTVDGHRDIRPQALRAGRDPRGLWAGDGGEGAKFWLAVLTEIKNRDTGDVCIVICNGRKGLPGAISVEVNELPTKVPRHEGPRDDA